MRLGLALESGETHAAARELGITGVPINASDLVENGVAATLAELTDKGLEVCQIGAFGVNPLSEDREAQASEQEMLRRAIPLVAETGCPYIVICGGNHHPSGFGHWDPRNWSEGAFDELVAVLEPLVRDAADHGAKISIEPYIKTAIDGPDAFHRLRDRLTRPEALVANVDVTSLYGLRDYMRPDVQCREVCNGFAGAYGLGHIKDIAMPPGFHVNMSLAPLGSSPTDWVHVLKMMEPNMPDDSWLILEHVTDFAEARESVAKLRDYASKAGVALT